MCHISIAVLFFSEKSENTKNFFAHWYKSFCEEDIPYDQVSLVDAVFKCDARVLPLTADWNYFPDGRYYAGKLKSLTHRTLHQPYFASLEIELLKIANILGLNSIKYASKYIQNG